MKKKALKLSALVILSIFIIACYIFEKHTTKEEIIVSLTYQYLKSNHYLQKQFDDTLSVHIYNDFLDFMDPQKLYFYQSDINSFNKYKYLIDNTLPTGNLIFFDEVLKIYNKRLNQAEKIYAEILSKPFDFEKEEYIIIDPKKVNYAKNKDELYEHWRLFLKYQTLMKLYTEYVSHKKDTTKRLSFAQMEEKARQDVMSDMKSFFNRMHKMKRNDFFNLYVNSITAQFDPYTEYFPPKQQEEFKMFASGELEGIGATLQQLKDGKVKIIKIIIGGPAYKTGKIEVGDKILKVAQGDTGKWVNIVGMRLDDAVRLIRGKKGTKVRLLIEKKDGSIIDVPIIRDKIIIEETYVRSLILLDTIKKQKIGYIYVPSFYSEYKINGRSVAKDFLKELNKMNNEKINAIIIDLRGNSGGSLTEVIKMVGYFIKKGPVVQVRNRNNSIKIFKDNDKKIQYKGKLMVLTDFFSASASEIFAAAIQDYNRGIIFGTKHTHGKGSVQTIIPYDQIMPNLKPLGMLKLTIQKFYRINGNSTQLKGVLPDIIYNSPFQYIKIGEENIENPLPWDTIKPAKYKPQKQKFNLNKIKKHSYQRMAQDSFFIITDQYAHYIKQQKELKKYPLKFEKYKQIQQTSKLYTNKLNKYQTPIDLKFLYTKSDQKQMQTDTIKKLRYDNWRKKLKNDHVIREAYNIMYEVLH